MKEGVARTLEGEGAGGGGGGSNAVDYPWIRSTLSGLWLCTKFNTPSSVRGTVDGECCEEPWRQHNRSGAKKTTFFVSSSLGVPL